MQLINQPRATVPASTKALAPQAALVRIHMLPSTASHGYSAVGHLIANVLRYKVAPSLRSSLRAFDLSSAVGKNTTRIHHHHHHYHVRMMVCNLEDTNFSSQN